jgi:hypothetical protein
VKRKLEKCQVLIPQEHCMAGDEMRRTQRAVASCARVGIKNPERAAVKRAAAKLQLDKSE